MASVDQELDSRSIINQRTLAAPRELVFDAFTKAEHVVHWYGPFGFSITNQHMNVHPNGEWLFTMHGPDGVDYPNRIRYTKVERPSLLEYVHDDAQEPPKQVFHVVVTFEESGDTTLLTMRLIFDNAAVRDQVATYAVEGGRQTMDRLTEYISRIQRLSTLLQQQP